MIDYMSLSHKSITFFYSFSITHGLLLQNYDKVMIQIRLILPFSDLTKFLFVLLTSGLLVSMSSKW